MRVVAVVSDIHGNLPALEAVLAEIEREGVDAIVSCGDVAAGPFPAECLALLREVGALSVRGNADRLPDDWVAGQLAEADAAFLRDVPATLTLEIDGLGRVLFCHATPRNDQDVFTEEIGDADVLRLFGPVDADVVVCGHTHMQVDRPAGSLRIVNPGSVGLPYESERGAYWALLGPGVEHRRTAYDAEAAAAAIRRVGWPKADEIAAMVLSPPSRREALDTFTPMFPG